MIVPAKTAGHGDSLGPTLGSHLYSRTATQFSTQELAKVLYLALVLGGSLKNPMALVTSHRGFANKLLIPVLIFFETIANVTALFLGGVARCMCFDKINLLLTWFANFINILCSRISVYLQRC